MSGLSPEEAMALLRLLAQGGPSAALVSALAERAGLGELGQGGAEAPDLSELQAIEEIVCRVFLVSREELLSPSRHRGLIEARGALFRAVREQTRLSLPEMGRRYGRHYTTVLAAVEAFTRRVEADPRIAEAWGRVAAELADRTGGEA